MNDTKKFLITNGESTNSMIIAIKKIVRDALISNLVLKLIKSVKIYISYMKFIYSDIVMNV